MKLIKKIIMLLICTISISLMLCMECNATNTGLSDTTTTDGKRKWNGYSANGKFTDFLDNKGNAGSVGSSTKNILGTIITVIRVVGTGMAIIMLTYVAIKYMTAAPNEKAEFKKSATAFIVGAIVLFATTNILGIISNFATKNIGN